MKNQIKSNNIEDIVPKVVSIIISIVLIAGFIDIIIRFNNLTSLVISIIGIAFMLIGYGVFYYNKYKKISTEIQFVFHSIIYAFLVTAFLVATN